MSTNGFHQSAGCPSILTNEGVWAHPAEEGVSCAAPWPAREARGLAGPGYDPRRGDRGQGGPGHLPRHSVPRWLCGGPGFPVCFLLFQALAFPPGGSAPPHPGVLLTFSVGVLAVGTLLAGSPGCSGSSGPPHLHCDSPLWPTGSPPRRDAGSVTSTSGSSALQRFGSRSDDAFLPASPGPKLALRSSDSRHFMVRKAVDSHTGKPLPDT